MCCSKRRASRFNKHCASSDACGTTGRCASTPQTLLTRRRTLPNVARRRKHTLPPPCLVAPHAHTPAPVPGRPARAHCPRGAARVVPVAPAALSAPEQGAVHVRHAARAAPSPRGSALLPHATIHSAGAERLRDPQCRHRALRNRHGQRAGHRNGLDRGDRGDIG